MAKILGALIVLTFTFSLAGAQSTTLSKHDEIVKAVPGDGRKLRFICSVERTGPKLRTTFPETLS